MKYFKKICGKKCYLSPLSMEDAEKLTQWINDIEMTVNNDLTEKIINLDNEKEIMKMFIDKGTIFSIVNAKSDVLIGTCGIETMDNVNKNCSVGIFIGDKKLWGKGYGYEAMMLLLDYCFTILNIRNVMLYVYEYNKRAIKCYKKCGFKEIGIRRKSKTIAGKEYGVLYMDILSTEFKSPYLQEKIAKSISY